MSQAENLIKLPPPKEKLISHQQGLLREFLLDARTAICSLRAVCQIESGLFDIDASQLQFLREKVSEKIRSGGKLDPWCSAGSLCQIGDNGIVAFQHHGREFFEIFESALKPEAKAVRGFFFLVTLDDWPIECVVFDNGKSRRYYDSMGVEKQMVFTTDFANRQRHPTTFLSEPLLECFVAFINDTPERFVIEKFLPGYSIDNQ